MAKNTKSKKTKINPLLIASLVIVVITGGVLFFTRDKGSTSPESADVPEQAEAASALNEDGDLVIPVSDVSEDAAFYETQIGENTVGVFAVKASDGTIRTALNTCQVCNGSPYAYFEQKGDGFQCQNCGNVFPVDMIGIERGGCNPVPISEEEKTESDTEIIIPAEFLEENAVRFDKWKEF